MSTYYAEVGIVTPPKKVKRLNGAKKQYYRGKSAAKLDNLGQEDTELAQGCPEVLV